MSREIFSKLCADETDPRVLGGKPFTQGAITDHYTT